MTDPAPFDMTCIVKECTVNSVHFKLGDRVEYKAPRSRFGKRRTGVITYLQSGGTAQVTDDSAKGSSWLMPLDECRKVLK